MRQLILIALLTCLSAPAFAIYKCEIEGKTVYRDKPCPGGRAMEIAPAPAGIGTKPNLAQDELKANQLDRERVMRESKAEQEQFDEMMRADTHYKICDALAARKARTEDDATLAAYEEKEDAQKIAREAAERYARECTP